MPERLVSGEGMKNGYAKLTDDDIAAMRGLRLVGVTQGQIAALFGVAQSHVSNVVNGRLWKSTA